MGKHSGRGPPVLAVATTAAYREVIASCVTADDVVLEVGSANGVTLEILSAYAHDVVGVDSSEQEIARCRSKFPALEVHQVLASLPPSFIKHKNWYPCTRGSPGWGG
jgi:cyclopropane fatty-acyl-phospholipid synthase-like methyltransferase